MPRSSGSIRPGSASIISARSACCPAPIWCWPMSRRARSTSGSRRRSPCCRCTIRSASPSNGRRSICCPTAASISPPGAAMTGANTSRSTSRSTTTRRSSRRAWRSCGACGRPTGRSRTAASITSSTMSRSRRKPVQRPIPAYVASFSQPSIELAARLGCGLIVAPFAAAMTLWRAATGAPISTTRPAPGTARSRAG